MSNRIRALFDGRMVRLADQPPGSLEASQRLADRLRLAGVDAEVRPDRRGVLGSLTNATPGMPQSEAYIVVVPRRHQRILPLP